MASIPVILMIVAMLLLGIRAFNLAPDQPRLAFGWAGLFVWALVIVVWRGVELLK